VSARILSEWRVAYSELIYVDISWVRTGVLETAVDLPGDCGFADARRAG
jgi:hypothetical protein